MQRRTPTKVRSRREQFRIEEIPTKDATPSINRQKGTSVRNGYQHTPRSQLRRAVSLDFTSNASDSGCQRRNSVTPPTSPERQRRLSESVHFTSRSISPESSKRQYGVDRTFTRTSFSPERQRRHSRSLNVTSNSVVPEHERMYSETAYHSSNHDVQDRNRRQREILNFVTLSPESHPESEPLTETLSGSSTSTSSEDTQETEDSKNATVEECEVVCNRAEQDSIETLTDEVQTSLDTSQQIQCNVNGHSLVIDFESDEDTQHLYKSIYEMWRNKRLCDVVFHVAGGAERYYAHKLVLAIECETFANRSTGTGVVEYSIPKVKGMTMKEALKFFYTGKIDVRSENIDDLLEICFHLRSNKLANLCKKYLSEINMATSVRNRVIAIKHGLSDVVRSIDNYIQEHFTSLVNSSTFLKSDFQIIFDIISSEMLTKPDELQVFHACASWINFDLKERLTYAVPLMNSIRFNSISPADMVSQVESVPFMTTIPECKDMLYKAFRHHALFRELIHSVSRHTSRHQSPRRTASRPKPNCRSSASASSNNPSASAQESDKTSSQDDNSGNRVLKSQPTPSSTKARKRYSFGEMASIVRNQITQRREERRESVPSTSPDKKCHCDAVKEQIKNELSRMKLENQSLVNSKTSVTGQHHREALRCCHSSISTQKQKQQHSCNTLIPTSTPVTDKSQSSASTSSGAQVPPGNTCSEELFKPHKSSCTESSTEDQSGTKSDPSLADKLTPTTSGDCQSGLLSPILAGSEPFNVSVISAPQRPPLIFAMGGVNPYVKESERPEVDINQALQQYVPCENAWSIVSQMPQALHHFAVTMLGDKIYVTGGHKSCTNNKTLPARDCFVYDIANNKWETTALLKTARARHVAVTLHDVIYVLGGIDCVEMSLRSMEYYDRKGGRWYFAESMRDSRVELAAVAHMGKILVVGGIVDVDEKLLLNTVEVFDPNIGIWRSKARFPLYVAGGSMVEVRGTVYYVGGYVVQDKNCLSVDSVFRYCDETDTWSGYQTLRVPRHAALVSAIGSRVYVVGGESSASLCDALTNVECIDVDVDEHVSGIAPLLAPAYGIGGCSLQY